MSGWPVGPTLRPAARCAKIKRGSSKPKIAGSSSAWVIPLGKHELPPLTTLQSAIVTERSIIFGRCVVSKNSLHFSSCACHPCAGAMLIFSVSFQV